MEYDEKYLNKLSRFMSLILRHRPESIGISLDEHGWANVDELLSGIGEQHPIDMDMLEEIVRADKKQRYSFNEDKTLIRANQGHSIPVDVELDEVSPPEELWHGTGEKYVSFGGDFVMLTIKDGKKILTTPVSAEDLITA